MRSGPQPKPQAQARRRFLVPRSHTPQRLSPGPSDRGRLLRGRLPANGRTSQGGLPERGESPTGWLRSELALGQSDPHPSASVAGGVRHAPQPSSSDSRSLATRARPQNHSPHSSGHILRGRRINHSDQGRPAIPPRSIQVPHSRPLHHAASAAPGPGSAVQQVKGSPDSHFRRVKGNPNPPSSSHAQTVCAPTTTQRQSRKRRLWSSSHL